MKFPCGLIPVRAAYRPDVPSVLLRTQKILYLKLCKQILSTHEYNKYCVCTINNKSPGSHNKRTVI